MNSIVQWFKDLWSKLGDLQNAKTPATQPSPNTIPAQAQPSSDAPKDQIALTKLRGAYVARMARFIGTHESPPGSNRGPDIDRANLFAGVPLGSSYCLAGALYVLNLVCVDLKLKNPVPRMAGTQNFFDRAPAKYHKGVHDLANIGDMGILQNKSDHAHGHAVVVSEAQTLTSYPNYKTIEWNTNGVGSANGDGVYTHTRSVNGDLTKSLRGFIDVCQWVMDANP